MQTLQSIEQMVDRYRMGCSIYMQLAEKLAERLKLHANQSKEALKQQMHVSTVPHVKLLQRITEPSVSQRIACLTESQPTNVSL